MATPESFEDQPLLASCRGGDEQAARQLFESYADRLLPLVRRRLNQRLASRIDPEDVLQSVFRTFFQRAKQGEFSFQHQDDLAKLLVRITIHKTLKQVAFHQAAQRDPRLELGHSPKVQDRMQDLLDHEPTPDVAAAFVDQLEHFLARLRPEERQVLELRLQGYSNQEITAKLGTYDRKIRRILERIRGLAEQEGLSP
jgi:RNA polymerase sigma-70 factor (ECF subfamily)